MDSKLVGQERRAFPRVNINFSINIPPSFLAQSIDISETGLSFVLDKPLLLSKAKAEVEISPGKKIETEFKVVWGKQLVKENKFSYGVAFMRLGAKEIDLLREVAVRGEIGRFINKISDKESQRAVENFFVQDVAAFMRHTGDLQKNEDGWQADKQDALDAYAHRIVAKGDNLLGKIEDRRIQKNLKAAFRSLAGGLPYKSSLMKQGIDKPYGYPGDYDVIEKIYNNKPLAEGFGKYFDLIFLNNPYARAVRSRKDKMKSILKNFITGYGSYSINILNFGCGPCREIRELFIDDGFVPDKKIRFNLLDQDKSALDYSKKILGENMGNLSFNYIEADAFAFPKSPVYKEMLGKMDMVYSIGLADYLPDRVFKSITQEYFKLVVVGGEFIWAHKDRMKDPHAPVFPDWFCDWHFVPRSEEYLFGLIDGLGLENMFVKRDIEGTGKINFAHLCRKKD